MRKPPKSPRAGRIDVDGQLAWLDGRQDYERTPPRSPATAFGLGRMRRLLALLGNPHHRLQVVHVAGTKGKGSTVAMLATILEAAGQRTGRYISPHVHRVEERICLDGAPITAADLARACGLVRPAVERLDLAADRHGRRRPTWFEVMTAIAFVHFARAGADVVVLETGLGGRLDATNVCRPLVTVITSISLDHMKLLGRTVGLIAAEKAGIIKRRCPVVSGAAQPSARRVIADTARRRQARLYQAGRDFQAAYVPPAGGQIGPGSVRVEIPATAAGPTEIVADLGMPGRHQADNAALAVMAAVLLRGRGFDLPDAAIVRGLAAARLPARIETLQHHPLVIVDAAHNVASMESLLETLAAPLDAHRPRVLVFAASRDKQVREMLAVARGRFDHVILTRYAINPRGTEIDRLAAAALAAGLPRPERADSAGAALRRARTLAGRRGMVVAAGSFFLAAEIRGAAGITGSP